MPEAGVNAMDFRFLLYLQCLQLSIICCVADFAFQEELYGNYILKKTIRHTITYYPSLSEIVYPIYAYQYKFMIEDS